MKYTIDITIDSETPEREPNVVINTNFPWDTEEMVDVLIAIAGQVQTKRKVPEHVMRLKLP